ncbi:DUF817 domain-containing protein [Plastoroseomonas arctica]|uniref:DUF817 domain-containing protein n=1 Tax=Plastoroseomonas arctica TaxID=1509237 RepID=A0AAF1K5E9_9PROT|nr:DUF817 domain-containing protein [Plastoroseomonas arctica]MBR0656450.1 DUF817 domain-containing protein [Plastoroseomonas arctica]
MLNVQPWPLIARFAAREAAFATRFTAGSRARLVLYEFIRFGVKQGWACLFGALMLAAILGTHLFWPRGAPLARYDALLLAGLAIQAGLLAFRLETPGEAKIVLVFHAVGTAMEVFKTAMGSWSYPEPSLLRLGGVPLFTGFMYAAVGSYIARAWRLFDFRFSHHPPGWAVLGLALAIYANFFSHHYALDARWLLFAITALLFGRCWVHFRVWRRHRRMPLLLGFFLVAIFIYAAENLGTFAGAWLYPAQRGGWVPVAPEKFGSWFLLMIISYALVFALHRAEGRLVSVPRLRRG